MYMRVCSLMQLQAAGDGIAAARSDSDRLRTARCVAAPDRELKGPPTGGAATIEALARPRRLLAFLRRAMPRVPESLYHPLWDAHPDHILLGIIAIAVAGGIWKLLAVAPLPGKLSRWGQKQIPAGECGLTEAQTDEASRDFSRTFGEPVVARSLVCTSHASTCAMRPCD